MRIERFQHNNNNKIFDLNIQHCCLIDYKMIFFKV